MFKIRVIIKDVTYGGLKALDHCRKLGLPDSVYFATPGDTSSRRSRYVDVGEEFAREHFGEEDTELDAEVPVDMLTKGDVVMINATSTYFGWNPEISDERLLELFVGAPPVEVSELD